MSLIQVQQLTKSFSRNHALRRVSFAVEQGEQICIVGNNGAGKSTLLRCIAGLSRPEEGSVHIDGCDTKETSRFRTLKRRLRIGFMSQASFMYETLTIQENLELYAALSGVDVRVRVAQITEELEIATSANKRFDECSQGIGRRAALARAVVHQPQLLLLDEPMANLDGDGCRLVSAVLSRLSGSGTTMLIATHEKRVLEQHCGRVLQLHNGSLLSDQTVADFFATGIALAS